MDYKKESDERKVHPRDNVGYLSLFIFSYVLGIYKQGFKTGFEENDMPKVTERLQSNRCGNIIEKQWEYEMQKHIKPSVLKLLWRMYGWRYITYGVFLLIWKLLRNILEPPALMSLITYFRQGQTTITITVGISNAVLVLILLFLDCLITNNLYILIREICIEMRTGLSSLIYRKVLKLKPEALHKISVGNVIILITKDIGFIEEAVSQANFVFVGFIQTGVVCYLLHKKLGVHSVSAIVVIVVTLILQGCMGKIIARLRVQVDKVSDKRIQSTKQAMTAIKTIKMYTLENFFFKTISDQRREEMNIVFKEMFLKFLLRTIGALSLSLSVFFSIMTIVLFESSLSPEIVLFILSSLRQIKILFQRLLPMGIGRFAELYGGCCRLEALLLAEELEAFQENIAIHPSIILKQVSVDFCYKNLLEDITFSVESGLSCLTGPIGSGKSSLLKTILREFPVKSGTINSMGQISYASQDPWIFPSTIRQNIIFNNSFDKIRYQDVITACALEYDFQQFENGDQTLVFEKGANLSNGQRTRINLARALYKNAEIYLLDDCLSALDNTVKETIFTNAIKEFLNNKLCVLVTQDFNIIQNSDNIILLENGKLKYFGKTETNLVNFGRSRLHSPVNLLKSTQIEDYPNNTEHDLLIKKDKGTYYEKIYKGHLKLGTYWKYIKFGRGLWFFLALVLLYFLGQVSDSVGQKFLFKWIDTQNKINRLKNNTDSTSNQDAITSKNHNLMMYSVFVIVTALLSVIKNFAILDFAKNASIKIHDTTVKNVLNAEMKFFDTHLIGNILNRFSHDINNIDEFLPVRANEFLNVLVSICLILVMVALVNWIFVIPMVVCLVIVYLFKLFYMPTGVSLKRLEAATKSPVTGFVNSTLDDSTTVRSFKSEKLLIQQFDQHLDHFTCVHYTNILCLQGFGFFVDMVTLILISFIMAGFFIYEKEFSGGDIALVLMQVFTLQLHIQFGLGMLADMQNNVASVERLLEYSRAKQEFRTGIYLVNWPKKCKINYEGVSFNYPKCKEIVLSDVTVNIDPNDKVGIIGRTGSGKSTFISTLFRLYNIKGKILIDGIDISTVNLNVLRKQIDIIGQNSFLFPGTVRDNLDPLLEYDDEKIWSTIKKMKIQGFISDIYMPVEREGINFTNGQRQLLCFARALMRNSKIMIFDEITASLDRETERLIIDLIRKYFSGSTVLMVSHSLETVMDCNKIIVFEKGEVIEYGNKEDLMEKENGYFSLLVKKLE